MGCSTTGVYCLWRFNLIGITAECMRIVRRIGQMEDKRLDDGTFARRSMDIETSSFWLKF